MIHDETRADPVGGFEHVQHMRRWHTGGAGGAHQRGLRGKRQLLGDPNGIRLTAENERTIHSRPDGAKRPCLLACAAREAGEIGNLLGTGNAPPNASSKASGEWFLVDACR